VNVFFFVFAYLQANDDSPQEYTEMMIHIPFFNTVLSMGDFLIARKTFGQCNVCLVKGITDQNQVQVTWWVTLDELKYNGTVVAIPSLPMDIYSNLVKCRVKEVVEDCASIDTINVSEIIDVAFVFHANTLEKEYVNCAGMSRSFFTHYQLINGG
jgi:hypothetical protein